MPAPCPGCGTPPPGYGDDAGPRPPSGRHRVEPTLVRRMTMAATPCFPLGTMFHTARECAPLLLSSSAPTTARSAILKSWNALNSHFPTGTTVGTGARPPPLRWPQYGWITIEAARLHTSYAGQFLKPAPVRAAGGTGDVPAELTRARSFPTSCVRWNDWKAGLESARVQGGEADRRVPVGAPDRRGVFVGPAVPDHAARHGFGTREGTGRQRRSFVACVRVRAPTMLSVTTRRVLGAGPEASGPSSIRAAEADIIDALPGIRLPDLHDLRARGVVGSPLAATASTRRALGSSAADEEGQPRAQDVGPDRGFPLH